MIKYFDSNGNLLEEKTEKPVNNTEVCVIGGTPDETKIELVFYAKELSKELINNKIKINPTKAWNPGEIHPIGLHGKQRIVDWGKWYLNGEKSNEDVNKQIAKLLENCSNDLSSWIDITNKYDSYINVIYYFDNWNREYYLTKEIMKMLVDRGLEIKFDVYFEHKKGES